MTAKYRSIATVALAALFAGAVRGQSPVPKHIEQQQRLAGFGKTTALLDRAGGTHNKSNIGLFFENRGKLYPRTTAQGPGGEWPIGSKHEYIYRINPYVGVPRSVIQGRWTTNEEWEASFGYHNRDSAKIAFSDKPYTWPAGGWYRKDAQGKPLFVSDQDSYCAYADSNNARGVLGLQILQTGYAFGQKLIRDILFYTFEIVNRSANTYDSLYFGQYMDIDVGDVPGGVTEYEDDKMGFNRNLQLVYFYDDGVSTEWPGSNTGYFGWTMLQSPKVGGVQRGITDLHYYLYDDDLDRDTVQYGYLSSAPSLYASPLGPRYFHPGANFPDLHFDDPATIPATGLDIVAIASSGPYRIAPGDTLRFVTALVAALTLDQLNIITQRAQTLLAGGFASAQAPDPPKLTVTPGDRRVVLTWDNRSESTRDRLTGRLDFEGYRVYKSIDRGQHWDQIDRNQAPATGADPVPMAQFDLVNGVGADAGLQYSFVDTNVVNGFEYWYSVTAFDQGDTAVASLECPRGNNTEAPNLGIAIPRQSAIGWQPVSASAVSRVGTGTSNVIITVAPNDVAAASGKTYDLTFAPVPRVMKGNPRGSLLCVAESLLAATPHTFSLTFLAPERFRLRDLTAGTVLDTGRTFISGAPIQFAGLRLTITDTASLADQRFEAGDSLIIGPGVTISNGGTPVLPLQPLAYGIRYATSTGVVVSLTLPATSPQPVTYADAFRFTTAPAVSDAGRIVQALDRIKVVPNPYLVSSLYEEEFGALRREPIRQLKFINLPARCTITIYTIDGDEVKTLEHDRPDGVETWDLRSAGGRDIAPGIYLYLVRSDAGEKLDRFAVIK